MAHVSLSRNTFFVCNGSENVKSTEKKTLFGHI